MPSQANTAPSVTDMRFGGSEMLFLTELHSYPNHPFRVVDDEEMRELAESIRMNGVREPLLVRPFGEDYQIVSGHRRKRAAELAELIAVPCIVKPMSDDEAAITMTESNLKHRQKLLNSEKAWAYRIQLEAMKRQGKRTDLTSCQDDTKLNSGEAVAENSSISRKQLYRYIRLTHLMPPLLERVDKSDDYADALAFGVGVLLSYLTEQEQQLLDYHITLKRYFLSIRQAQTLKELSEKKELTEDAMLDVLEDDGGKTAREPRLVIRQKEFSRYFPSGTSNDSALKIMLELLENYRRRWQRKQNNDESKKEIEEDDTNYSNGSDEFDDGDEFPY